MVAAYDTSVAGVNAQNGFISGLGGSWSHTSSAAQAKRVGLVYIASREGGQTVATGDGTATWGGVAMTKMGFTSDGDFGFWVFGIQDQSSGAATVAANVSNGANTGREIIAHSASYLGVLLGTVSTVTPVTGTALSQTVTGSNATEIISQGFGCLQNGIGSYSQTSRQNQGTGDGFAQCCIGDAVGGSSVSFTATGPNGAGKWAGLAVRLLLPAAPPQFFAMF